MSNMDIMYRAYRELLTAMGEAATYFEMTEALSRADDGCDMHGGTVSLREIDMDWVEAIEKAIPCIDAAIREQRRFIVQEDEIVPIEKSRKITSESVRHLAQHTNMIAKFEGDEVTPESILNIYREESFAIYENRFLRTLLENASRFVETRYEALIKVPGESVAQLAMNRTVRIRQEQVRVEISYETEYRDENEVDIAADVSKLSKFQRVLRIRKILSNFMATPLLRALVGTEPVRPPITRTNLLTKNNNFRAALDLWVFLKSYTKNGYYTVLSKADGRMGRQMKKSLYDVICFTRFVVRLNLSDAVRAELEAEYEAENARRAAEAARIEEERRQAEEKRLRLALAELSERYETELADQQSAHEAELARQQSAHEARVAAEKEINVHHVRELTEYHEMQMIEMKAEYEAQLSKQQDEYETHVALLTGDYEVRIRDHESRIRKLKSEYEVMIQDLVSTYEAEKNDLKSRLAEQLNSFKQALLDQKNRYIASLIRLKARHNEDLDRMQTAHSSELAAQQTANNLLKKQLKAIETGQAPHKSTEKRRPPCPGI